MNTSVNPDQLQRWRASVFRLLEKIAPAGSSLDVVFGSYDDWREYRAEAAAAARAEQAASASKQTTR
jgi:hypothetical protein